MFPNLTFIACESLSGFFSAQMRSANAVQKKLLRLFKKTIGSFGFELFKQNFFVARGQNLGGINGHKNLLPI